MKYNILYNESRMQNNKNYEKYTKYTDITKIS